MVRSADLGPRSRSLARSHNSVDVPQVETAEAEQNGHGSYVELVVSSSKCLVEKSKQEIVDLAVRELR